MAPAWRWTAVLALFVYEKPATFTASKEVLAVGLVSSFGRVSKSIVQPSPTPPPPPKPPHATPTRTLAAFQAYLVERDHAQLVHRSTLFYLAAKFSRQIICLPSRRRQLAARKRVMGAW